MSTGTEVEEAERGPWYGNIFSWNERELETWPTQLRSSRCTNFQYFLKNSATSFPQEISFQVKVLQLLAFCVFPWQVVPYLVIKFTHQNCWHYMYHVLHVNMYV